MDEATRQFINQHINHDVHQLALQAGRYPDVDMPLALRQITGRQKMKLKVPLFFHNEAILYPVRLSLEQASSEVTARYKASLCSGSTFADLTGGMGIDTYFISRNFDKATYIEQQAELCELARHNFKALGADNIEVINTTAEKHLAEMQGIDCIYLDPARRDGTGKKVVLLSDCEPDIAALAPQLLQKAKTVMVKLSPMLDISSAIQDIPSVRQVHIIAVDNECKEILLILAPEKAGDIQVQTVNFLKNGEKQTFGYPLHDEQDTTVEYARAVGKYLYEPNAAIMKSGAFKLVAQHYGLKKLHQHTHLYTSDSVVDDFPGRIFEVLNVWGNSAKEWKKHLAPIGKANISVRNYPQSAAELRKKLKLSEGGNCYLFACTLAGNEKTIIECGKFSIR